jgi:hypothetical protein
VAIDLYSSMKCCSSCSNPNSLLDIVITRDFDGPRCKLRRSSDLVQSSHGSNKHCRVTTLLFNYFQQSEHLIAFPSLFSTFIFSSQSSWHSETKLTNWLWSI